MSALRLAFALLLGAVATGAPAATITVTDLSDQPGSCPGVTCTLRAAIVAANPADTIVFDPAFGYPASLNLAGTELAIGKDLIIVGPGPDRLTVSGSSQSRVFNITAGTVRIEGLGMSSGRHVTPAGNNGTPGSVSPGQSPQPAEGGCVRVSTSASLELLRVALRSCLAQGGSGGHGGNGLGGGLIGTMGGSGGNGGAALGGAIANFGTLSLIESSVQGGLAFAGRGGDGGDGGDGMTIDGMGGGGGLGGAAHGASIYAGNGASVLLRNSTLTAGSLAAGMGGEGGVSNGMPGGGGNGGSTEGGQLYLGTGMPLADVEFASLGPTIMQPGVGGPGGGGGTMGSAGLARGEALFAGTSPRIRHSVLVGEDVALDCQGSVTASGDNLDSDDSCAGFNLQGSYAANFVGPAVQEEAGRAVLLPRPGAATIDAASDCNDLDAATVARDQSARLRPLDGGGAPGPQCDVGASEFDPRIFANGFEGS